MSHDNKPTLHRTIGPVQLALYGLGSMLGAGIYGLIGQAAGQVGNAVWLAFAVALVAALLTPLSMPRSRRAIRVRQVLPMSRSAPMVQHF